MNYDASSENPGICKHLVCGCIRVCSCNCVRLENEENYQPATVCWSPNNCRPWISSWFDKDKAGDNIVIHRREKGTTNKKVDGDADAMRVFPTQAKRTHLIRENVPAPMTLPPLSHIVVGHPSLEIYRCRLPLHLLYLLDIIVDSCTAYANSSPSGWM